MHLIGLLSIILRYNGFAKIQKDVVDQTGSRSPNSDCYLFGCKFSFGKCFRTSSRSSHWTGRYQLFHTIYFSLHITIQSRNGLWLLCRIKDDTSKWCFFMICGQLMSISFFHSMNQNFFLKRFELVFKCTSCCPQCFIFFHYSLAKLPH